MFCVLRLSLFSVLNTLELWSLYSFYHFVKDLDIWVWGLVIDVEIAIFLRNREYLLH